MKRAPHPLLSLIPLLVILETIAFLAMPQLAQTQSTGSEAIESQAFEPPSEDGEPDNTAGGGSRNGSCLNDGNLLALTSITDPDSIDPDSTRFSIALPSTSARALVVKIEDEHENLLYYDTLAIETSPGTLDFHIPETHSLLEVGKQYKWTLSAICGEDLDPNDPTMEGLLIPGDRMDSAQLESDSVEQPN
jgi:Domain of Unknown Function (DUF928)